MIKLSSSTGSLAYIFEFLTTIHTLSIYQKKLPN